MSQHADESVDQDLLLAFSTEPGQKPPESAESLAARVQCLERSQLRSSSQVESLKAEFATLVTVVDDIKTREFRGVTKSERPRRASAVAATLVGVAIGVAGWMAWSNGPTAENAIRADPVAAEEQPIVEPEAPRSPPVSLAATAPVQREISNGNAPVSAPARIVEDELVYVGTLSIDADPAGGRVYIDRRAAGSTPLRVNNLKAGSHLVWIEREGYRRWTQVVQVRSDRVSRVSASLEPLAAP